MDKFDSIMLWIKQIILNVNVTVNYIVDLLFSPVFALIDTIQSVVHQWSTKPNDKENNERHIGFQR